MENERSKYYGVRSDLRQAFHCNAIYRNKLAAWAESIGVHPVKYLRAHLASSINSKVLSYWFLPIFEN